MDGVTPKLVLDNRVNVSENYDEAVRYSGVNVNQFQILPDGAAPYTTQILFNNIVVPNLATTLVSRDMRLSYKIDVQYQLGNANAPRFANVYDNGVNVSLGVSNYPCDTVLRAPFALQSVCDSVQLTLNGGTSTINSRQVLDPLARRFSKKYLMNQGSEAPSQLDNRYQLLTDAGALAGTGSIGIAAAATWAAVVAAGAVQVIVNGYTVVFTPSTAAAPAVGSIVPVQVYGANGGSAVAVVNQAFVANTALPNFLGVSIYAGGASPVSSQPLSAYQNCNGASRASFLPISAVNNAGTVTVSFVVTEQLYLSPLTIWDNETFLANVNTLSILLTWGSLADIFYSANPNVAIGNIAISEARLNLQYIQTNPAVMKIPQQVTYNYENIVYFSKSQSALAGAAGFKSAQFQSDTIRLQALPSLMYVIMREPVASRTPAQTQTFYSVGTADPTVSAQISISLGNRTGLMASASPATWYREAKRLGFNGSWNEWYNGQCVLMIDPTSTLGIDPSLDTLVGETGSINFQLSGTWNNLSLLNCGITGNTPNLEMLIVCVYSGVAKISTDQCMFNIGPLSGNEINATLTKGQPFSSEQIKPTIQGEGLASHGKLILGKMAHK